MNTYIKAIIILIIYILFTRALFIAMIVFPNSSIAFLIESSSASLFGIFFLYFFEHKNLFKFAQVIENKKRKSTEKLIEKFLRFGKYAAVIIAGFIGGPLVSSLSTHILLSEFKYRYYLTFLICLSSSFLALAIARGILHLAFKLS